MYVPFEHCYPSQIVRPLVHWSWWWCCVTPCYCKYSQICFNFNSKIKPFREHQRATRLHSPLYIQSPGSLLILYPWRGLSTPHSSWKCWQIWGYCGHIPALWPTMEICHRDKLHVAPAPTHWWQGSSGPILELFLTDHPQLELETKVKWRFEKVSIVSCSRPSLMASV